mmetsp:Transcript_47527/g.118776  ORF Transcript_47527/g.118776 Transcript_47527/m.118776 type:complete len:114 (-) Transcript_47527:151-492(-)
MPFIAFHTPYKRTRFFRGSKRPGSCTQGAAAWMLALRGSACVDSLLCLDPLSIYPSIHRISSSCCACCVVPTDWTDRLATVKKHIHRHCRTETEETPAAGNRTRGDRTCRDTL